MRIMAGRFFEGRMVARRPGSPFPRRLRAMTESEFHLAVDEILARIERSLEHAPDLDFDAVEGILTIECGDGSRVIVNRQTPNREIWVAAKSGGFHFAFRDGAWRDTRSGADLFAALAEIIVLQGGPKLSFAR